MRTTRPATRSFRRGRGERRPQRRKRLLTSLMLIAAAVVISVGYAVGNGKPRAQRSPTGRDPRATPAVDPAPLHVPAGPIPGYLLIADRGNNRILLVANNKRIVWQYPSPGGPSYPFRFDDDAFFGPHFRTIITNQEEQHTIQLLGFPNGRLRWRYGQANLHGSTPGYLNTPDDAYQLPNGLVSVADASNCRVLFLNRRRRIVRELGRAGACAHAPPRELGAVNGATPLPGGGTLVSEINGSWIDAFSRTGRLMWDFHAPVSYPSDPQWLGDGHILLADYTRPGRALIVDTHGRVLWRYGPPSGPGMLDHPSLAMRVRPGLIAVNDDYRDRVILISIRTHHILWQYGRTDVKGRAHGDLNTPDGMDVLPTAWALATPATRAMLERAPALRVRPQARATAPLTIRPAPFQLPAPVERAVAVAWNGRILVAGGLDSARTSAAGVFALDPATGHLRSIGSLPLAFHDAAASLIRGRLFVFGGGSSTSSDAVQAFDPGARRGLVVAHLPRPLSDLAAAELGGSTYLVGGYDGRSPRAEILVTHDGERFAVAGRLPLGLRYPAVTAIRGQIVVAGGQTAAGLSSAVYAFNPATGRTRLIGRLPVPVAHAAAIAAGSTAYVIGGINSGGAPTGSVNAVDLSARSVKTLAVPGANVADAATAKLGATAYLIGGRRGRAVMTILEVKIARPRRSS
jgi:hypothetical protein